MRPIRFIGVIVLLSIGVASGACSDSSPTTPSQNGSGGQTQGLAGSWQATRAEFVSSTDSNVRIEVVSRGTILVLALDPSGTYTRTITDPGQPQNVESGTWSAGRDVLTLRPGGMSFSIEFDYTLSGNTLTLTGGHVEFDVDADGAMEEAILNSTLTRR